MSKIAPMDPLLPYPKIAPIDPLPPKRSFSSLQGWQCAMMYVALLLPLDILTFYFDIYAYDTGISCVFSS